MKVKVFAFLGVLILATACTVVKEIPVEHTVYVDRVEKEIVRDTLIRIELQQASISDFVDVADTLTLSTDLATAKAYVDTTRGILAGNITNTKPYVEKPVPVKEKIVYRDSLVYRDVPVEVEKVVEKKYIPWIWKLFGWFGIIAAAVLFCRFVLSLRKPLP